MPSERLRQRRQGVPEEPGEPTQRRRVRVQILRVQPGRQREPKMLPEELMPTPMLRGRVPFWAKGRQYSPQEERVRGADCDSW